MEFNSRWRNKKVSIVFTTETIVRLAGQEFDDDVHINRQADIVRRR